MIDAICRWNVPYTLEMAERMQGVRRYWIEEPLAPDNLEGYAQLCREVRGPLIESAGATGLHDRHGDEIALDEVERIGI